MNSVQHQSAYAIWLAAVEKGSQGIYSDTTHGGRAVKTPVTVDRLTATQIIAVDKRGTEYRFRRDNGTSVGGRRGSFQEFTQDVKNELDHARLNSWLKNKLPEMNLTLDQLRELYAAVQKITAPKADNEKAE